VYLAGIANSSPSMEVESTEEAAMKDEVKTDWSGCDEVEQIQGR
jgi:hypothetical protein